MHEETKNVMRYTDLHIVSYVVTAKYPDIGIFFCVSTRWCNNRASTGYDTYETRVFRADGEQYRIASIDFSRVEHKGPSVYNINLGGPESARSQHDEVCNLLSLGELTLKLE